MVTRQELPEKWNLCNNKSILGNGMKFFSIRDAQFVFIDKAVAFKKKNNLHIKFDKRCPWSKYSAFFIYIISAVYTIISEYFYFRYLHDNALGCECTTVNSLFGVQKVLSSNTQCSSPNALTGVFFSSTESGNSMHFSQMKMSLFQCSKLVK